MSTQHTPGPWKVKAGTNAVLAGRKQICSHVNAASALTVNMVKDYEIAQANARLIAAAPDLLGALQNMLAQYNTVHGTGDMEMQSAIDFAHKAIAKARGVA